MISIDRHKQPSLSILKNEHRHHCTQNAGGTSLYTGCPGTRIFQSLEVMRLATRFHSGGSEYKSPSHIDLVAERNSCGHITGIIIKNDCLLLHNSQPNPNNLQGHTCVYVQLGYFDINAKYLSFHLAVTRTEHKANFNPLALELFFFKFQHILYIKCE